MNILVNVSIESDAVSADTQYERTLMGIGSIKLELDLQYKAI